ncbi:hypothetical protein DFH06DRAFT_1369725 [Mycena polygramma]|nr:hypothetical protein DFH06DRAFT_1369725 [Mycena polygramma]
MKNADKLQFGGYGRIRGASSAGYAVVDDDELSCASAIIRSISHLRCTIRATINAPPSLHPTLHAVTLIEFQVIIPSPDIDAKNRTVASTPLLRYPASCGRRGALLICTTGFVPKADEEESALTARAKEEEEHLANVYEKMPPAPLSEYREAQRLRSLVTIGLTSSASLKLVLLKRAPVQSASTSASASAPACPNYPMRWIRRPPAAVKAPGTRTVVYHPPRVSKRSWTACASQLVSSATGGHHSRLSPWCGAEREDKGDWDYTVCRWECIAGGVCGRRCPEDEASIADTLPPFLRSALGGGWTLRSLYTMTLLTPPAPVLHGHQSATHSPTSTPIIHARRSWASTHSPLFLHLSQALVSLVRRLHSVQAPTMRLLNPPYQAFAMKATFLVDTLRLYPIHLPL